LYALSDSKTEVYAHYEGTPNQPVGSYVDGVLIDGLPVAQDGKITVPAPTAGNPIVLKVIAQKNGYTSPAFVHTFIYEGLSLIISDEVDGKVTAILENYSKASATGLLSLAAYSEGVLVEIVNKTVTVEPNASISIDLPASSSLSYKAFAWDAKHAPLTQAASYK
jgi:hypothetical protein